MLSKRVEVAPVRMQPHHPSLEISASGRTKPPSPPRLALVIPTLREAGNIRPLLARVRAALESCGAAFEVIVVDDDSRDGIEDLVAELAIADPRIRLIVRRGEQGLAGAVLRGWAETGAPLVAVMDADLQHPPELLPLLWSEIEAGADLAVGSRYADTGSLRGWNPLRHLVSLIAIGLTFPVQRPGMRAHDPMSGFFVVRRSAIDGIVLQKSGFKILLDILARADLHSVVEVPFTFGRRYAGSSKANLRVAFDYFVLLARLYTHRLRPPFRPRHQSASMAADKTNELVSR